MMAMFMSAVEATIVATAMPSIVGDLGGFHLLSWVFSIYLLTQAVSIPIYGKLADMFGRRLAFNAGVVLFLTGSILAGFAGDMQFLIVCRALQGLGAGALMPVASTIVGDIYPGAERGRVQGWLSSVWGVSAVTGPALGAFLVQHFGWPLVFWLNIPVGLLAVVLLGVFLREPVPERRHRIDFAGAVLLMTSTTALLLALIQGVTLSAFALGALLTLAAACLLAFVQVERRAEEPMMPPAFWRHRVIANGNLAQFAAGAVMIGVTSFVPIYVQGVMGRTPLEAGFALTAMSIGWPLAATVSGRSMATVSFRRTASVGAAALLAGATVLALLEPGRGPLWAAAGAFLVGIGMGCCNTTFVVSAQSSVERPRRGAATSVSLFMRMLGQSTGAAAYGAMLNLGIARQAPGMGDAVDRMLLASSRATIAPEQLQLLTVLMADALRGVYLVAGAFAVAVLLLALRLPRGLNSVNAAPAGSVD